MTLPILSVTVSAPFVAAVLLLIIPDKYRLLIRWVALFGAIVSLVGSIVVANRYDVAKGGFQLAEKYPLVPSLGINLQLAADGWSVSLLLLTGLIIVAGVFATWTLRNREREFFIMLLLLVAGVLGVFVAQDLFIFFLFYEIAVLPMYLLIGIWGSSHAVTPAGPFRFIWKWLDVGGREYAAMKLTLMLLVGSAFILAVIIAMYLGGCQHIRHGRARARSVLAYSANRRVSASVVGLWNSGRRVPLSYLVTGWACFSSNCCIYAARGRAHEAWRFWRDARWDDDDARGSP